MTLSLFGFYVTAKLRIMRGGLGGSGGGRRPPRKLLPSPRSKMLVPGTSVGEVVRGSGWSMGGF